MRSWIWSGKPWRAFKNFAILFSFVTNLVLIVVLLIAAPLVFPVVKQVAAPIVGGLYHSFIDMNDAHIINTIAVDDDLPVKFELPLSADTRVTLTEPVPLSLPATMALPAGGGSINGTVSIQLPVGLELPVHLDLNVPVSQTVPINLLVDVDIPLSETQLGQPFGDLKALFSPLDSFLSRLPGSNEEAIDRLREGAFGSDASPAEPAVDAQASGR